MYGKIKRMNRLFDKESNHTLLIPMDHGATVGPIDGIEKISNTIQQYKENLVNGIVLCKGQLNNIELISKCNIPIIMHLSNSSLLSPDTNNKVIVGSVESAVAMGADAVSVHINMGDKYEADMLKGVGKISDECLRWGMPLLAMMYVRGGTIKEDGQNVKMAARLAQEIGADIVKIKYVDFQSLKETIEGVTIPIVAAGGEHSSRIETLKLAKEIMDAGAAGISFGRRIFQDENPKQLIKALSMIVHENRDIEYVNEYIMGEVKE